MSPRLQRLRLQLVASESAALIGARIRGAREDRGWTRRELARQMDGVATENDIYRWEKGQHRPRDDALAAAARALERPLSHFVDVDRRERPDVGGPVDVEERLARIEEKLDELLNRTARAETDVGQQIHEAFEDLASRLGREVGKRPPRSRRAVDRSPEAPPAAA